MLTSYQDLTVWQKSVELVLETYQLTKSYPREEVFGIVSQTRRAVVSIPANITEGYARKHRQEYIQFLRIAFASGAELETLFILGSKLKMAPAHSFEAAEALLQEVMKMLNGLIGTLVAKP